MLLPWQPVSTYFHASEGAMKGRKFLFFLCQQMSTKTFPFKRTKYPSRNDDGCGLTRTA